MARTCPQGERARESPGHCGARGEGEHELRHDALFATYGERGLPRDELARFPSYFVCVYSNAFDEYAHLMTLLGADVPG